MREIAPLRVNGHDAGTLWAKPLQIRVDPWLYAGPNALEIEVTICGPIASSVSTEPGTHYRFIRTNIGPIVIIPLALRDHWPCLLGPFERHENDRMRRSPQDPNPSKLNDSKMFSDESCGNDVRVRVENDIARRNDHCPSYKEIGVAPIRSFP